MVGKLWKDEERQVILVQVSPTLYLPLAFYVFFHL